MFYKCKHFKIEELVSPGVYKKYGEKAWEFFNPLILKDIDFLRELFKAPITINNWCYGGNYKESGLRANKDEMVKGKSDYYLSAHCLGNAFDIKVKGFTPKQVFDIILKNQDKFNITRIEDIETTGKLGYVHIDISNINYDKGLYVFKP